VASATNTKLTRQILLVALRQPSPHTRHVHTSLTRNSINVSQAASRSGKMAASGPAAMQMLPPPEDRLYSTFQELHEDLKKWTLAQGYALSIDSSSNRDATGIYRRYNLSCIRGGKVYKPSSTGQRNTVSKKTGCLMKIKATKQDGWPWNGRWRITVMCGDHNHPPFNPDIPNDVPPAFRHVEGEGLRWLLIMHREAKLNLRQLTIGLRTTFGDKYRFVKKSDVSNTLSKVKREEEKEMAKRPPGAPPVPPGAMTAFMAALLNPVPDPYQNGVPYELVPQGWPAVPNYQSTQQVAGQGQNGYVQQQGPPQQYVQQQQGQPPQQQYAQPQQPVPSQPQQYAPQGQPPQQQQQYAPPPQAPQQPQQFTAQQFVPQQPAPSPAQAARNTQGRSTPAQRNKNQAQPAQQLQAQQAPVQQNAPVPQASQAQQPSVPAPVQQQGQAMQWKHYAPMPATTQPQQQQPQYQPQPQQQQPPPQQPQPGPAAGRRPPDKPGPADRFRPVAGQPSVYQPTALQATPVPGDPGVVMMPRAFSPVSDDESDGARGAEEEDVEADDGEADSD
jgi:hypothetical protein